MHWKRAGKAWEEEELDASVKAYIEMRRLEERGEQFVKKRFYEALSAQFDRSPEAFEYRMQNISHTYASLGRSWIRGLKPAKHVGSNASIIKKFILKHDNSLGSPKPGPEEQASKPGKTEMVKEPPGSKLPSKQTKVVTQHDRDPDVIEWLLQQSKGVCESCEKAAPFVKDDGGYYLEVHHLRRLADGGSDRTSNAIAICPNCHRELHYGIRREELLNRLYDRIERLKRE